MKHLALTFVILATATTLSACSNDVQYSSGADYLAQYQSPVVHPTANSGRPGKVDIDAQIVKAANVEPNLRLPGFFGVARIVNGRLSAIPEGEMLQWRDLAARHPDFGAFTPINPLVAELAASSVGFQQGDWNMQVGAAVQKIRLGAARQHLDAVLIYEVGAQSAEESTVFALANLTIIGGAFVPTKKVTAEGRAVAMFVDVLNGYPYGTATASADLSKYFTSWGSGRETETKREEVIGEVVKNLVPEVEEMMLKLQEVVVAER